MKIFQSLLLVSAMVLTGKLMASDKQIKVIYGDDNRLDVFESPNSAYVALAQSTATMIAPTGLRANGDQVDIVGPSLQSRGMCADERFSNQSTAAMCSGFLVGDKYLVTAGHCITSQADCQSYKWVFDYKVEDASQSNVSVPKTSVYSCKKIISRTLDRASQDDYAFIELDRAVSDRAPLTFRKTGKIKVGDDILVIGHPTGLPTKITDGAKVRSINGKFFMANLDTYGGNSGSAVFNATTGIIEGILVRGENDYNYDSSRGCRVSNLCPENGCRGEDVTIITNIKELKDI
ncbi:MAG: trypsin-like peptidase domain-containing protein [Bacteriovoracaceae bacterium]|nr:trypsin-like peptidase domain-containing protein [Bacteriovoracaceae bacterium]